MTHSSDVPAVLVVDDNPMVRRLAVAVLEREGYQVSSAADGQEAVELFGKHREEVDLLLTDLTMPRKTGVELIREVRAIKPEQPVVVMSGNLPQNEKVLEGLRCISKPFTIQALLKVVEEGLE